MAETKFAQKDQHDQSLQFAGLHFDAAAVVPDGFASDRTLEPESLLSERRAWSALKNGSNALPAEVGGNTRAFVSDIDLDVVGRLSRHPTSRSTRGTSTRMSRKDSDSGYAASLEEMLK
ncbi:hypothetical protein ACVIW2_009383 [Bradyrhizobium huanghuaihaiense]